MLHVQLIPVSYDKFINVKMYATKNAFYDQ